MVERNHPKPQEMYLLTLYFFKRDGSLIDEPSNVFYKTKKDCLEHVQRMRNRADMFYGNFDYEIDLVKLEYTGESLK